MQNQANRRNVPHSCPYKGVSFDKPTNLWRASIRVRGKYIALGRYITPEAARDAYLSAAQVHFGEFATSG
jgi:hypothetical protein